jgi:hypothetical protein
VEPNWKPLEGRLGRARCAGFMYMGRVNGINLYKHGISRTYLNLDDAGNCFVSGRHGCHVTTNFDEELKKVELCLEALRATLETQYDELFIAQKRAILRLKGIELITIQIEPEELAIH